MLDRIVPLFRGLQHALGALFCCLLITSAFAQTAETAPAESGANLAVSQITFGPGEEVWERVGHNAI